MLNSYCNVKSSVMEELYSLHSSYHWVLADSALLQAIEKNEPVALGVQGRRLNSLVKLSSRIGIVWILIATIGFIQLIRMQRPNKTVSDNNARGTSIYPICFFIGFGAGAEEALFNEYCKNRKDTVDKLDQINASTFAVWHQVSLLSGFRLLLQALVVAKDAIDALPSQYLNYRTDFLTCVAKKLGYYIYMRTWFESLKVKTDESFKEVAFLSPDTAAFAAVDACLPVCFIQHGMIRKSLLLPKFTRIEALTMDEATHMKYLLPSADITVHVHSRCRIHPSQMSRSVLVASVYGDAEYMSLVLPVVSWVDTLKIPLLVRPHPRENGSFWEVSELSGKVVIARNDADIFKAIYRLRPRLVVSWFSTALIDVLECGVIPVTLCKDDDIHVADLVYPLFKRCLRWPEDRLVIERLLDDDEYYESVLSRLTEGFSGDVA